MDNMFKWVFPNRRVLVCSIIGTGIGVFLGSSMGVTAMGTAINGAPVFGIIGLVIGNLSGRLIRDV